MASKKITYNSKTRNDISNPFNKYSHQELLNLANVEFFNDNYEIQHLSNGRIKVHAVDKDKRKKHSIKKKGN